MYVAAGSLHSALSALREAQLPDTAAMFLLACHEIYGQITACSLEGPDEPSETSEEERQKFQLPSMKLEGEDLTAVSEFFGQYQRKLVHLCMDVPPHFD